MRSSLVPIGNSFGIRLPKAILKICHIQQEVDLDVKGHSIIIHPVLKKPRKGWEAEFKKMRACGEDHLIIDDLLDVGVEDWEW